MEEYIEDGDMVMLGDRYESQLCAIEMNAGCLIISMNYPAERYDFKAGRGASLYNHPDTI